MTFALTSVFAPLIFWLFLIDPFTRRPLSRNYLKLYKNGRFFFICLILAIILIVLDRSLLLSHRLGFPSIPLWFILLSRLLVHQSFKRQGYPFKFRHKGDHVKFSKRDNWYSFILWFLPFVLSFFADLFLPIDRFVYSIYLKLF